LLQVLVFAGVFPIVFCGEIKHFSFGIRDIVNPDFADFDEVIFAMLYILFEHLGIPVLEFKGNAGTHYAYAVDGIDQGLAPGSENIIFYIFYVGIHFTEFSS
jgi:hypothetical protein